MRWPWVSEWRLLTAEIERDRAFAERAKAEAKYDALLAEHLAYLKPQPVVTVARTPIPMKERDPLMVLASERGGRDAGLRRHLVSYVNAERQAGTDDEAIADRLTHWNDPEDEES